MLAAQPINWMKPAQPGTRKLQSGMAGITPFLTYSLPARNRSLETLDHEVLWREGMLEDLRLEASTG